MIVVLMGVAGSGKTTAGMLLGHRLKWPFHDTDDLHPTANRDKMSRGTALTDDDRREWLQAVRDLICCLVDADENAVIACSALKSSYREQLAVDPSVVRFVYLKGSLRLIAERLASRRAHFFRRELLQSQFDTIEEPKDAIVLEISAPTSSDCGFDYRASWFEIPRISLIFAEEGHELLDKIIRTLFCDPMTGSFDHAATNIFRQFAH